MALLSGFFSGTPADMSYFLQRKYDQLQQQADATTSNAASQAITANAQANSLNASAGLDVARTRVLPAESAAQIGLQGAQANLLGQQAKVVVPESTARIAQLGAETAFTGTQNKVLTRNSLTGIFGGQAGIPTIDSLGVLNNGAGVGGPATISGGPVARAPAIGTTSSVTTPTDRRPGESYAAWTARLRQAGY